MSTKTNYIGSKLITNIKKVNLLGYFLPSKISDFSYSIETLAVCQPEQNGVEFFLKDNSEIPALPHVLLSCHVTTA